MKKRSVRNFLPVLLLLLFSNLNAQVYNGNLSLTSQAEVDAFNYSEVTGELSVSSASITNLNGLSELISVGGTLAIFSTIGLTDINGLSNLSSVHHLLIGFNSGLQNVDGLSGLSSIAGGLLITNNGALENLDGLSGVTSINEDVTIKDNNALVNVDGLANVVTIGMAAGQQFVKIFSNNALISVGLSNLATVGGSFEIFNNDALISFNMPSLTFIEGSLRVKDNNVLPGVDGLSALNIIGSNGFGGILDIWNNPALTNLDGLSGLTQTHYLNIENNSSLANINGLSNLVFADGSVSILNNDALTNLDGLSALIFAAHVVGQDLIIQNNDALFSFCGLYTLLNAGGLGNAYLVSGNGANPTQQQIIDNGPCPIILNTQADVDAFNYTSLPVGLLIYDSIPGNITNLNGLSELTSVGGSLRVIFTYNLADISGLSNLSSIGRNLEIGSNDKISNLDALSNLSSVGGNLHTTFNATLNRYCGLYTLLSGNGLVGTYTLSNNAVNPTQQEIIDGEPCPITLNTQADVDAFNYTSLPVGLLIYDSIPGNITNLNGLSELTSVGGSLQVIFTYNLADISGLSNLSSIGRNLEIGSNDEISNLDALLKLSSVGGNLHITFNATLNRYCGLYTLLSGNGLVGTYTVSNNVVNPTVAEILAASDQPPVIADVSVSSVMLAPPNHKMRDIIVNYNTTSACGPVTTVLSVTSNEPINGTGDGDTDPDWIIVDDHHVKLRAERAANGSGRIYTITITATNLVGVTTTKTVEVRVAHNITGPHSGNSFKVGSTVAFSGEFWDKPGNNHTAKWLIDGSTTAKASVTEPAGNKNGKVTGSYKFGSPGVYKLQMSITDQHGITSYANTNGDLEAIVVIYDPNGGHTYGGGYYNSPAGALKSNLSATGKASYGFAMNYFKNSTNPKGETQFEFKVGEFEFNALNFEYLVISNSMAQFKGTGKIIGGQSGVGFTMTVTDGQLDGSGVDKIRMKIYNKNNGAIIYDNQHGASDAALPVQAVGTNSIVVINGSNSSLTSINTTQKGEMESKVAEVSSGLDVAAFPNPSATNFTISVKGNANKEKITMQVTDMFGRVIEIRNVNTNSITKFGDRYRAGTYFVRIMQGKEHKEIKLIKLSE